MTDNSEQQELVELQINYEGDDFLVCVSPLSAEILLNDPEEANIYIEEHCLNQLNNKNDNQPTEEHCLNLPSTSNKNDDIQPTIWSSKSKKSTEDTEATLLLLKRREYYSQKFDDKKTAKGTLWHKIASEIKNAGYNLGEGGAEKCRQKFCNMQKQYLKHRKHMKTTGTEKKNPPPYFEEMHSIIGHKDKVDPTTTLQDSLSETDESEVEKSVLNRFSGIKSTTKPKSSNNMLLDYIKEENAVERTDRERHYANFERLLETQNKQRDKMLDLLGELVNQNKKRPSDNFEADE